MQNNMENKTINCGRAQEIKRQKERQEKLYKLVKKEVMYSRIVLTITFITSLLGAFFAGQLYAVCNLL